MGKLVEGVEQHDSESKEQRELKVYLEILGGQHWPRSGVFPAARDQERRTLSLESAADLQAIQPIATHHYVTARLEAETAPSKLLFPREIVGVQKRQLVDGRLRCNRFDGFAACQLSTSRS
jgi:hypothetical protein